MSDSRLSDVEQHALLAVWRLGDEAYGASIRDELTERTGRRLSVSAVYATLVRLERGGLVVSRAGEPTGVRGGKARRLFRIQPAGVGALKQARRQLDSLWQGLEETAEWKRG